MARTDRRGGPETKNRIAQTASQLFFERGFDDVTVAEVARTVGVSSVTVFKYFPKKEDLFFDRADEISDLLLEAVQGCSTRADVRSAIRALLLDLLDRQHPLSGVDDRSVGFFSTVAQSPTLVACARQIAADIQQRLTQQLELNGFDGDAPLLSAFFIAGYSRILTETAANLTTGTAREALMRQHRARINLLLESMSTGVM